MGEMVFSSVVAPWMPDNVTIDACWRRSERPSGLRPWQRVPRPPSPWGRQIPRRARRAPPQGEDGRDCAQEHCYKHGRRHTQPTPPRLPRDSGPRRPSGRLICSLGGAYSRIKRQTASMACALGSMFRDTSTPPSPGPAACLRPPTPCAAAPHPPCPLRRSAIARPSVSVIRLDRPNRYELKRRAPTFTIP